MRRLAAAVSIATVIAMCVPAHAQGLPLKLLVLPSPRTPELFEGEGRSHIAYELLLANFTPETIRIDSLKIGSTRIDRYGLRAMFTLAGANPMKPQEPVLRAS
jgi:hypothetical protein